MKDEKNQFHEIIKREFSSKEELQKEKKKLQMEINEQKKKIEKTNEKKNLIKAKYKQKKEDLNDLKFEHENLIKNLDGERMNNVRDKSETPVSTRNNREHEEFSVNESAENIDTLIQKPVQTQPSNLSSFQEQSTLRKSSHVKFMQEPPKKVSTKPSAIMCWVFMIILFVLFLFFSFRNGGSDYKEPVLDVEVRDRFEGKPNEPDLDYLREELKKTTGNPRFEPDLDFNDFEENSDYRKAKINRNENSKFTPPDREDQFENDY